MLTNIAGVKIKMRKNYLTTIILTIFYLLIFSYSNPSYAEIEKYLHKDKNTNKESIIITSGDDITTFITPTLAREMVQTLESRAISHVSLMRVFFEPGSEIIVPALQEHKALTELCLNWTCIDNQMAKVIADILRENTTLTKLGLSCCFIKDEDSQIIVEALLTNSSLVELDLKNNYIGCKGAQALAKILLANNTLKVIDISMSCIDAKSAQTIVNALMHNIVLQDIVADWFNRPYKYPQELKTVTTLILERNKLFTSLMPQVTNVKSLSKVDPKRNIDPLLQICDEDKNMQTIIQESCDGNYYSRMFYNLVMYGTKKELLQYLSAENLKIVNKLRVLQTNIIKIMKRDIPKELQLIKI